MAAYPKDRFDQLPDDLKRIGAHRGPQKKGGGWLAFAVAVLATGLLVFGGLWGLSKFLGVDVGLPIFQAPATPTPTPTPTPTADPVLDPTTIDPTRGIKTTVLNGTPAAGLEDTVGDALAALGWVIDSRTNAGEKDVAKTVVYYSDPANEDVARGVVVSLGIGEIRLVSPETFPGMPLTVVIGLDYPGATPAP
ncbi:MAG: LytR C-terminal domain-containing protein [Salinibacterium sp.]|nr:LytR C-terminal domain-containing protein [Salinibacterium sp.]